MKLKKSQLNIQEMSFMLLAVVLFFILAGLFALSIVYSNLHESANSAAEEKTLAAIPNLASSAELRCSGSRSNCIDEDKLLIMTNESVYKNYWPFSSFIIVKSSAFNKTGSKMVKCGMQNYPDCDEFVVYDSKKSNITISSYVALCRKESENDQSYERCELAKMYLGTELKETK